MTSTGKTRLRVHPGSAPAVGWGCSVMLYRVSWGLMGLGPLAARPYHTLNGAIMAQDRNRIPKKKWDGARYDQRRF
jgi:hypothetical protein